MRHRVFFSLSLERFEVGWKLFIIAARTAVPRRHLLNVKPQKTMLEILHRDDHISRKIFLSIEAEMGLLNLNEIRC
jgi:hypothetical protein